MGAAGGAALGAAGATAFPLAGLNGEIPPNMVAIGREAALAPALCAGNAPVGSATSSTEDESSSMGVNAPVSSAVSSIEDESSSGGTNGGGRTLGEVGAGGGMLGNFGTGGGGAECPMTVFASLGVRGMMER